MPTTTFSAIFPRQHVDREASAGEEVLHALLHERRAVLRLPAFHLPLGQPVQGNDFPVQGPIFDPLDVAPKAEAQERHVPRRVMPAVDADQARWLEAVRGLFQHLALAGGEQGFAAIEMSRRLVQDDPPVDPLFDQEEAAAALDDRGDRNAGPPDLAHAAFLVFLRMKSAMRCTPASIACLEAAYEKRTCWPSPGTRVPKWMSASTATPASLSRRRLRSSESAAPMRRPVLAQVFEPPSEMMVRWYMPGTCAIEKTSPA